MLCVTLDTNIYISALNYRGNPSRLLELAREGKVLVAVPDQILDEVERVLRDKFHWPEQRVQQAKRDLRAFSQNIAPSEVLEIIKEDPPDSRILECAAAARSEYIICGDDHLLRLKTFRDIPIVKVASFLDLMAKGSSGEPV